MAFYEGTFACGHDGRVNIIGPSKERMWKKERTFSGLCPDCYKAKMEEERQQENIKAAKKSSEMDLPLLTGTEKQVAWATTLRLKVVEEYEEILEEFQKRYEKAKAYLEKLEQEGKPSEHTISDLKLYVNGDNSEKILTSREEVSDTMDYILSVKIDASFWIDNRNKSNIFGRFIEEYRNYKSNNVPDEVKEEIDNLKEQLTVVPDIENKKSGIVELICRDEGKVLSSKYIKDNEFIKIVRALNFKWDGNTWYKEITEYTGSISDRAAELGNRLLSSGYIVQFPDKRSKSLAVSGKFKPENNRWVKWHSTEERFSIVWKGKCDTLYGAAKKLPGARWKSGSMAINIEFYKEVLDFAETMGFEISQKALTAIGVYKKKESGFETAVVIPHDEKSLTDEERIAKALKSDGTIIEDLIDE